MRFRVVVAAVCLVWVALSLTWHAPVIEADNAPVHMEAIGG